MYWKTYFGRCIYEGEHEALVHQNQMYRWLTLGSDAIQTLIHRNNPSRAGLPYIPLLTLAARTKPGPTCLLGLGGGGVAHILAPLGTQAPLIAIDNNQTVIDIAASYFMTSSLKNLSILQHDAYAFVNDDQAHYEHLLIDLFGAHHFPAHCKQAEFFSHCQQRLSPEGVLAINLANLDDQWPIVDMVRQLFLQRTLLIPIKGTTNLILLAYNGASIYPLLHLVRQQRHLKKVVWTTQWGCYASR